MNIEFRYATHDDLPAITAIYNQAIPTRQSTADLEPVTVAIKEAWFAAFDHTSHPIWLLLADGKIAGWVSLQQFSERYAYHQTAEISIYFDRSYQHQHLGQTALDFVFDQLPALGLDTIVADVFHHNTPSQRLFTRNGFEQWGHLPRIALMDGQRRDLDILGRHFGSNA